MAAQRSADSRWIVVTEMYDHLWPSRAMTNYPPGEYRVKNEVADRAIAKGKAKEGRLDGSEVTKAKPKRATRRKATTKARKPAKKAADAKTADIGSNASLVDAPLVAAGSPGDRDRVDQIAG